MNELRKALIDAFLVVATAAVPILGGYVVAWLNDHRKDTRVAIALRLVRAAVLAAEQMYGGLSGDDRATAEVKLQAAMARARSLLAHVGIDLTDDQLRTLIEHAVLEMKTFGTILGPPTDAPVAPPLPPPEPAPQEPLTPALAAEAALG
jgi:hypothetical protein